MHDNICFWVNCPFKDNSMFYIIKSKICILYIWPCRIQNAINSDHSNLTCILDYIYSQSVCDLRCSFGVSVSVTDWRL